MVVKKESLKRSAMAVWYIGATILYIKSYTLLVQAYRIDDNTAYMIALVALGIIVGLLKTKYIFTHALSKNMTRIDTLATPKIWQFYRIPFMIFLFTMIALGAYLSRAAQGDYGFLAVVAVVDMALAIGLSLSGLLYTLEQKSTSSKKHQ